MMDIVPRVTINGLSLSRVVKKPLTKPRPTATSKANATAIQIDSPAVWVKAIRTPVMPAIAATERSRPPAMMSGVPAAAIKPMKATLPPIVSMLLIERKNGERIENATIIRR